MKKLSEKAHRHDSQTSPISIGLDKSAELILDKRLPRYNKESVILVDSKNNVLGSCEKMTAHRRGLLHRAFSILITNQHNEMLLQQRAVHKYHFASCWSNACCGHPRPGESISDAAHRRLAEELGFTVPLTQVAELTYRAEDEFSGLVEYEYLHVFHGLYAGEPCPNPDEVGAFRWMRADRIRRGILNHPGWFTPWFRLLTIDGQTGVVRQVCN